MSVRPSRKLTINKEKSTKKVAIDPKTIVSGKYTSAGWIVYKLPNNCINHIIAHRGNKLHFVRVNPKTSAGVFMSTFIQNALSNSAIPVYAFVEKDTTTFTDVNVNQDIALT